jgi:putative peptidoglycan binding protein/L,D-transpeptidase-like protein
VNQPDPRSDRGAARAAPLVAAAALIGTVVVVGLVTGLGGGDSGGAGDTTSSLPAAASTAVPTTALETTTTAPKTVLDRTLGYGSAGDDVTRLQERLTQLRFNPGPVDGQFGSLTQAAVWAYEKLVLGVPRDEATGQVTPEMWDALQDRVRIRARRPDAGKHTEIYLPEQVIVVFNGNRPAFISHMSSGDGEEWVEEVTISPGEYGNEEGTEPLKRMEQGLSLTPGGVFEYNRMVKGRRESALGGMLNPVYFNWGIAVHGAFEVPLHPASHGCIRIPNAISERFQSLVAKGETVYVWDGEKDPEDYGAQLPPFNTVLTTTTTTTTTIAPPPTTAPPTTQPAPRTTPATTPPATTTTSTTDPSTGDSAETSAGRQP